MANRICPLCGGNNTAKILWGMPAFTPELEDVVVSSSLRQHIIVKIVIMTSCIPLRRNLQRQNTSNFRLVDFFAVIQE